MPRREDIEQFKRVLASYGAGPKPGAGATAAGASALAEPDAGERDTRAAPGGEPAELGDIGDLGDFGDLDAADAGGAAAAPVRRAGGVAEADEEGAPPDIGDLLSSLDGELGGASAPADQGDENLDLSALFGEEETVAPEEAGTPARGRRQKKPRPPRAPKEPRQPKGRRERRGELSPETSPEPAPEPSPGGSEAHGLPEEFEPSPSEAEVPAFTEDIETVPSEAPPAPEPEPSSDESEIPFLDAAEAGEPSTGPEEPAEALPEFLGPLPTTSEVAEEPGAGAEEALLAPFEGTTTDEAPEEPSGEAPSLTGDLEQFSVLPEEPAPAEPDLGPVETAEEGGAPAEPPTEIEPDLSGLEEGVTHSDLPDIGGLDELTLPDELPAAPPARPAARTAARAEAPRGAPTRAVRAARAAPRRETPGGAAPGGVAGPAPSAPVGDIELSDEQFDRLRTTLGVLPRNLKIAVQDIVAGAASPTADLAALIGLLVSGAGAKEIAALAGRITGKRIRIPAAYERRTGLALEREQRTFAYAFRQNILPLVRLFALAVVGAGLVGFLGYRFVWQPLSANASYRRGYEQLQAGRFPLANERFARATDAWPMRRWYFRYAEGFRQKRQLALAAEKYEQLLGRWPNDRKAVLDWAAMESKQRASYAKADAILHRILDRSPTDYAALLAAGDNFLEWATQEGDPQRFESARLSWTELMKAHGQGDEVLFRMLRYFVRTDDLAEAERLRAMFFDRRRFAVDTEAARSLAELGGYLVDKRHLDWVRDVLLKAAAGDDALPDVPYQLARFYRVTEQPSQEQSALEMALTLMEKQTDAFGIREAGMQIDARTRLGEMFYGQQKYLDAARELRAATALVKRQVDGGVISAEARARQPRLGRLLGRPFAKLADVSYYIEGDLATAADGYRSAAAYGYTGPEIDYKLGYIAYAGAQWLAALGSFSMAEEGLAAAAFAAPGDEAVGARVASAPGRVPINLVYAQGNAFYRRGDLFSAQGSWLRVLEAVETRLAAISELDPFTRPDHRALLEYRMRANNNLGVATAELAARTGDRRRTSQALAYLAAAAEIADLIARSADTLVASEAKSLPALNMRGVLYPLADFVLQIYPAIPKDLEATTF